MGVTRVSNRLLVGAIIAFAVFTMTGCKGLLKKKSGTDAGTTTTAALTGQDLADEQIQEKLDDYIKCLNSLASAIHQSRHQFERALAELEQALQRAPGDPQAWLTRASILSVLGRHAEAVQSCAQLASAAPLAIVLTLNTDTRRPKRFAVSVDGERIGEHSMDASSVSKFVDIEIPIPSALTSGKPHLTVKVQGVETSEVPPIVGLRLVRQVP